MKNIIYNIIMINNITNVLFFQKLINLYNSIMWYTKYFSWCTTVVQVQQSYKHQRSFKISVVNKYNLSKS